MKNSPEATEIRKDTFKRDIILIGIITLGAIMFGFFEASFFNTYIEHILRLDYIYIAIMVSVSAVFGLIFLLVFGVISDNTRSEKFGRRRPYLLFGSLVSGICMIIYPFSPEFIWCFILDAIIIGVFSNMYYAAQRTLVPDLIEIEHRGRANGLITIFSIIGIVIPIFLMLFVNQFYSVKRGGSTYITQEGYIFALFLGGLALIIAGVVGFFFLRHIPPSELEPKKKFFDDLKETFQYDELRKHRNFFRLIIAMTVFNLGYRIIFPFLFNYIFSLGLNTTTLILALGILIPVIVFITLAMGKLADTIGRKVLVAPVLIISSIGYFMIPFLRPTSILNMILLIIAITLVFLSIASIQVPLAAWQQDLLPEGKRGQFLGILNVIFTISQIPGAIIGGVIADSMGLAWIFAFAPIFLLASIPLFLRVKETLPEDLKV